MASKSNVGDGSAYGKDDQRNITQDEANEQKREARFHEGKEKSHNPDDPKDERSIANRLERESKRDEDVGAKKISAEDKLAKEDPTAPARMHGNEPSKGAKIDKEIADEEAEILKKKGAFGPK